MRLATGASKIVKKYAVSIHYMSEDLHYVYDFNVLDLIDIFEVALGLRWNS